MARGSPALLSWRRRVHRLLRPREGLRRRVRRPREPARLQELGRSPRPRRTSRRYHLNGGLDPEVREALVALVLPEEDRSGKARRGRGLYRAGLQAAAWV